MPKIKATPDPMPPLETAVLWLLDLEEITMGRAGELLSLDILSVRDKHQDWKQAYATLHADHDMRWNCEQEIAAMCGTHYFELKRTAQFIRGWQAELAELDAAKARVRELEATLKTALIPLAVWHHQDLAKPYVEVTRGFAERMHDAHDAVLNALSPDSGN